MESNIKYQCLAFGGVILSSNQIPFKPDLSWKESSYFTINGNLVTLNYNGAWTCIRADQPIKEGIHHFTCKISKSNPDRKILPGFICQSQKDKLTPNHQLDSYNAIYFSDGTTRSKGIHRHLSIPVQSGEVIHTVCDMNNHIITWIRGQNSQVLGQAQILPQFQGKPMIPLIYFINKDDQVQIC